MFNEGVDEQLIQATTHHNSLRALRQYKRVSIDQRFEVADLVAPKQKIKKENPPPESALQEMPSASISQPMHYQ